MTTTVQRHSGEFRAPALTTGTAPAASPRAEAGAATVVTTDGYPIAVSRLSATAAPIGMLIVAGAIGVPQRFYRRFTKFAQRRGYDTVTFDYRGVARSAPASLRDMRMDLRDWGRQDLAAVIADTAARAAASHVPVYLVAHSFGGHALGLTPNHAMLTACFSFGTGAGWHGWMTMRERLKVLALWNVAGPLLTRWKGYLPWQMLRMGEDLPLDVYRQWRQWCRYPRFFLDDPAAGADLRAAFASVRTPILAVASSDDAWSPPRSRDAMLSGFTNASIERCTLDPATLNLPPLGHMGFFRPDAQVLWPMVLQWLESHAGRRAPGPAPKVGSTVP